MKNWVSRLCQSLFCLGYSILFSFSLTLQASGQRSSDIPGPVIFAVPPDMDSGFPSGESRGGDSRDDCLEAIAALPNIRENNRPTIVPLSSLVSLTPQRAGSLGYTTSDRPTLWVYNPFNFSENSARLEVDNAAREEIQDYETHVIGPLDSPGIISLPFPDDVPPLAVGEIYRWHFLMYCGNVAHEGRPLTVSGSIMRVEHETVPEHQIWYDRLTEVGTAFRNDPTNPELANQWTDLMRYVDEEIDSLANQPIQDCCTLERSHWP